MDENENNNEQEEQEQEESTQQEAPQSPGGGRGAVNKGKKAVKDGFKKAVDGIKQAAKEIWKRLDPKTKLIIIAIIAAIILFALLIIVLSEAAVGASSDTSDSYYNSLEADKQTEGSKLYLQTGSFLFSTQDEISAIADLYYKELEGYDNQLKYDMMAKYKDGDKDNSGVALKDGAVATKQETELYKHILNTEKYNFNRVVWREFNRDTLRKNSDGTPKQPTMQLDDKTKLQYPKDNLGTTLEGFASLIRPYLQTWIIPYTMYVGVYNDGASTDATKNSMLAYELISSAYHNITIDKYNMENLTTITKQNIYDEKTVRIEVTVTCTDNNETVTGPISEDDIRIVAAKKALDEKNLIKSNAYDEYEKAQKIYTGVYGGSEAIKNAYDAWQLAIKDADAAAAFLAELRKTTTTTTVNKGTTCVVSEPVEKFVSEVPCIEDKASVTRRTDIEEKYYKKTIKTFDSYINYEYTYKKYNESEEPDELSVARTKYTKEEGTAYPTNVNKDKAGVYTSTYKVKDGYTETTTKVYKDKISQSAYEKRAYTTKDVEDSIIESPLSQEEKLYYNIYEQQAAINKYDIMNASKESYSKYIFSGEEYSRNIGYHRDFVFYGLNLLKNKMVETQEQHKSSFAYGASLGVEEQVATDDTGLNLNIVGLFPVDYSTLPAGGLVWPSPGVSAMGRGFGPGMQYIEGVATGKTVLHAGIDISTPMNTQIVASADGKVIFAGWQNPNNPKEGGGKYVKIQHENGYQTAYLHLNSFAVKLGDEVKRGQVIGLSGTTGSSTGPHLHYAVKKDTVPVDPARYVNFTNTAPGNILSSSPLVILEKSSAQVVDGNTSDNLQLEIKALQNSNFNQTYRKYVNESYFTGWTDKYNINGPKYSQSAAELNSGNMAGFDNNGSLATSVSMAITGLTGERIWGPWETYNTLASNNDISKFVNDNYSAKLNVLNVNIDQTFEKTKADIIAALKTKAVVIVQIGSSGAIFPDISADKYYSGVSRYLVISGIKDGSGDKEVYTLDSANKTNFQSSHNIDTIMKVIKTPYYILSRKAGYSPNIIAVTDPTITGGVQIATSETLATATTTGWCKDFKEVNWNRGTSTVVTNEESVTETPPPASSDSTGVLASMQAFYKADGLKGLTDYSKTTWDKVTFSPENAQYALDNYKAIIYSIAPEYGVDPLHVISKMAFESSGGRYTGYGTGAAAGPMQIQKSVNLNNSISAYNVNTNKLDTIVMNREALSDNNTNIRIGIMMYANILKTTGGNPFLAAQKYNMGNINMLNTYATRVGKNPEAIMKDYNDVGWLYDVMKYHNDQSLATGARWGDGYYAYKFAMYLDWLAQKVK